MGANHYARPFRGHPEKGEERLAVRREDGTIELMLVDAVIAREVTKLRREGKREEADLLLSWFEV